MQITFVLVFTHSSFESFIHSTKTPGENYYSKCLGYGNKHEKQSSSSHRAHILMAGTDDKYIYNILNLQSDTYCEGKINKKPKRKRQFNTVGGKRAGGTK